MFPPHLEYAPEIVALIETIHIAAVGTMAAFALSIPVAYLSAENLTPNRLTYALGKVIVTVSRSVHTIIWALVFVIMFGPGALAGTIAIAVRSVGFLGKLLGEELEEIDAGQQEAISSTGANRFKTLLYGSSPDQTGRGWTDDLPMGYQRPRRDDPRVRRRGRDRRPPVHRGRLFRLAHGRDYRARDSLRRHPERGVSAYARTKAQ